MSTSPMRAFVLLGTFLCGAALSAAPPELQLPPRAAEAMEGSVFADKITSLSLKAREEAIAREVLSGNVPGFLRRLKPVAAQTTGSKQRATIFVTPDYLAVGSDKDYFRVPMTPGLAQRIADGTKAILPTRKMVNDIWAAADRKLAPSPIPPSPAMSTVPVFRQHHETVEKQLRDAGVKPGDLVAGIKKDVVVTPLLGQRPPPPRVAIYGWHYPDGRPIQPLSLVHKWYYADYSHGVRLVSQTARLDRQTTSVQALLADPATAPLLSDEGVMAEPQYPETPLPENMDSGH